MYVLASAAVEVPKRRVEGADVTTVRDTAVRFGPMKRSSHSFDLAVTFFKEFDLCAEVKNFGNYVCVKSYCASVEQELRRLENSSSEIRKICRTDSKMDVSKSIAKNLSDQSLQRYQVILLHFKI